MTTVGLTLVVSLASALPQAGDWCDRLEISGPAETTVLQSLAGCEGLPDADPDASLTDDQRSCLIGARRRLRRATIEEVCAARSGRGRAALSDAFPPVLHEIDELDGWLATTTSSTRSAAEQWAELTRRVQSLRAIVSKYHAARHGELVLVSQGGVSLGSWQSGFVYGLVKHMQATPAYKTRPLFPTVTGASAGSINGLLAASASCERPEVSGEPEESLFYRIWVGLGLFGRDGRHGLFDPEVQESLYILSPKALKQAVHTATAALSDPARYRKRSCRVDLGFPVTHLDAATFAVHQGQRGEADISAPRLTEQFVMRIDADEAGGFRAVNLRPPKERADVFQPPRDDLGELYPLLGTGYTPQNIASRPVPLGTLAHAVRASGAFPLAFPPVELELTRVGSDGELSEEKGVFIDGGFLDNTPLGLAVTVDQWRSRSPDLGSALLRDLVPEPPKSILLVDPNVEAWPNNRGPRDAAGPDTDDPGLFGAYSKFLGGLAGASLSARLVEAAERYPYLRRASPGRFEPTLVVPRRNLPIAGAELMHFLAFFEQDYRVYDFFVGMADATQLVQGSQHMGHLHKELELRSPRYGCMRAYYDAHLGASARLTTSQLPEACGAERLGAKSNLAFREAVDQLDDWEREACEDAPECVAVHATVAAENFRAMLVAMHNYRAWQQAPRGTKAAEEDEPSGFERLYDELAQAGFHHIDLQSETNRARITGGSAEQLVRELMDDRFEALSSSQPSFLSRTALGIALDTAANAYKPRQPRFILALGITTRSGLELGSGLSLFSWPVRMDLNLRIFKLGTRTLDVAGETQREAFIHVAAVPRLTLVWPSEQWSVLDIEWGLSAPVTLLQGFRSATPVGLEAGLGGSVGAVLIDHIYLELRGEYALRRARWRDDLDAVEDSLLFGNRATFMFASGLRATW